MRRRVTGGARQPEGREGGREEAAGPGGEGLLTPSPSPAAGGPARRFRLGRPRAGQRGAARRGAGQPGFSPPVPTAGSRRRPCCCPWGAAGPRDQPPAAGWAPSCGARSAPPQAARPRPFRRRKARRPWAAQ